MLDGIQYGAFSRRQGISRVSAADVACVVTALLVTPLRSSAPAAGWRLRKSLFVTLQLSNQHANKSYCFLRHVCSAGGQPAALSSGLAHGWWAAWDALQDPSSHQFSSGLTLAKALQVSFLPSAPAAAAQPASPQPQSVLVTQMRNLMTPTTRASRKIFFAKFDATGDLAQLRHPKVLLMLGQLVVASKRADNKYALAHATEARFGLCNCRQVP